MPRSVLNFLTHAVVFLVLVFGSLYFDNHMTQGTGGAPDHSEMIR